MHKTRTRPGSVVPAPIIALGAAPSKPAPRTERTAAPALAEAAALGAASTRGTNAELGDTFVLPVEVLLARMQELAREAPAASAERRSTEPASSAPPAPSSGGRPPASPSGVCPPAPILRPLPGAPRAPGPSRDRSVYWAAMAVLSRAWAEAPLRRKALIVAPLVAALALGMALVDGQHADASATTPVVRAVSRKPAPEAEAANSPAPLAPAATAARPAPGPGITPERAAADAAAEGRYAEAAELYGQLARAEPKREVWREAARILRERSGGNRITP